MTALRAVAGGLILSLALAAFGFGVVALIRGHIGPLHIRSRRQAAALMAAAVVAFVLSGAILPPISPRSAPAVAANRTSPPPPATTGTAGPTTTPTAPAPPPTTERTVAAPALPTITSVPTTTAAVPITPSSVAPHPPPRPLPGPAVLGPGDRDPSARLCPSATGRAPQQTSRSTVPVTHRCLGLAKRASSSSLISRWWALQLRPSDIPRTTYSSRT